MLWGGAFSAEAQIVIRERVQVQPAEVRVAASTSSTDSPTTGAPIRIDGEVRGRGMYVVTLSAQKVWEGAYEAPTRPPLYSGSATLTTSRGRSLTVGSGALSRPQGQVYTCGTPEAPLPFTQVINYGWSRQVPGARLYVDADEAITRADLSLATRQTCRGDCGGAPRGLPGPVSLVGAERASEGSPGRTLGFSATYGKVWSIIDTRSTVCPRWEAGDLRDRLVATTRFYAAPAQALRVAGSSDSLDYGDVISVTADPIYGDRVAAPPLDGLEAVFTTSGPGGLYARDADPPTPMPSASVSPYNARTGRGWMKYQAPELPEPYASADAAALDTLPPLYDRYVTVTASAAEPAGTVSGEAQIVLLGPSGTGPDSLAVELAEDGLDCGDSTLVTAEGLLDGAARDVPEDTPTAIWVTDSTHTTLAWGNSTGARLTVPFSAVRDSLIYVRTQNCDDIEGEIAVGVGMRLDASWRASGELGGEVELTVGGPAPGGELVVTLGSSSLQPGEETVVSVEATSAGVPLPDDAEVDLTLDGVATTFGVLRRGDTSQEGASLNAVPLGVLRAGEVVYRVRSPRVSASVESETRADSAQVAGVQTSGVQASDAGQDAGAQQQIDLTGGSVPIAGIPVTVIASLAGQQSESTASTEVEPTILRFSVLDADGVPIQEGRQIEPNQPITARVEVDVSVWNFLGFGDYPINPGDAGYERTALAVCATHANPNGSAEGVVEVQVVSPAGASTPRFTSGGATQGECVVLDQSSVGGWRTYNDFPAGPREGRFSYEVTLPSDLFPPGTEDAVRIVGALVGRTSQSTTWRSLGTRSGQVLQEDISIMVAVRDLSCDSTPEVDQQIQRMDSCWAQGRPGFAWSDWEGIVTNTETSACRTEGTSDWAFKIDRASIVTRYGTCLEVYDEVASGFRLTDASDPKVTSSNQREVIRRINALLPFYSSPGLEISYRRDGPGEAGVVFEEAIARHEFEHVVENKERLDALISGGLSSYLASEYGLSFRDRVRRRIENPTQRALFDFGLDAVLADLRVPSTEAATPEQAEVAGQERAESILLNALDMVRQVSGYIHDRSAPEDISIDRDQRHDRAYAAGGAKLIEIREAIERRFTN